MTTLRCRTSPLSALLLFVLGSALIGCGSDRTVDEWRRRQVDEEIARIRAISGSYVGQAHTESAELTLEADTRLSDARDRPGSEQQAVLRAKLLIVGSNGVERLLTFDQGAYDSTNGSFKAQTNVLSAGATRTIAISGLVDHGRIRAKIEVVGYSDRAWTLDLERGSLPPRQPRAQTAADVLIAYAGESHWTTGGTVETHGARMTVLSHALTTEQEFLELLLPVRPVDVTLSIDFGTPGAPQVTQVFFPNASWDQRFHTLRGTLTGGTSAGGDRYGVSLQCRSPSEGTGQISRSPEEWVCEYISYQQGRLFTARLTQSDS